MTKQTHAHEHDHGSQILDQINIALKDPEQMKYWRSVEHRQRTQNYVDLIKDEFKDGDSEISGMQRRDMLKLMGASFALAGAGVSCRRPVDNIMPYSKAPEGIIPGIPNYFATARPSVMGAVGLVVESHEGRPTKIEGNPEHPFSAGAAGIHDQAAILEMYDPDRSRVPIMKSDSIRLPSTWAEWDSFAQSHFASYATSQGQGLAFLLNGEDSPTINALKKAILAKYPKSVFFDYNPLALANTEAGAQMVFGKFTRVLPVFSNAKVILTLQADPFMLGAGSLSHARGFSENRKIYAAKDVHLMNRLYVVEAAFSVTGTNADHRLRVAAAETEDFLKALTQEMLGLEAISWTADMKTQLGLIAKPGQSFDKKFIKALAKDLAKNKGQALIVAGEGQSAAVHGLVHVLNWALGGAGKTFRVLQIAEKDNLGACDTTSLAELVKQLNAGAVKTLVMLDTNPVYASAGALAFTDALQKAKTVVHLGFYDDETAQKAHWHLPMAHFLESWGDARAFDGTASIIQPLISPLFESRTSIEILSQVLAPVAKNGMELVKETWGSGLGLLSVEKTWRKALHDGIVVGSAFAEKTSPIANTATVVQNLSKASKASTSLQNIEVLFQLDYSVLDGRFANLGWLQELPDPITKITWDNALLMSQTLAKALGVNSRVKGRYYQADVVSLALNGKTIELPVFIMPGLADFSVVAFLGYGRKNAGIIGNGIGVDVYPLLSADGSHVATGAQIKQTGQTYALATTQEQFAMNGDAIIDVDVLTLQKRDPARLSMVDDYAKNSDYTKKLDLPDSLMKKEAGKSHAAPAQMTAPWPYTGNKWGMVIDLTSCIGCNACVTACQSENNIPVVGKTQVMRSRSMHWIRVDRYFTGDVKNPQSISQPVPCMHCENAPCEPVCPVAATTHDTEGLNVMAYNRCVGTRYCGNNCPYKVRRFNYLDFSNSGNIYVDAASKERNVLLQMQNNPDVTVRYRGVMEKCTYCTQRIQEAKMSTRRNGGDVNNLPDGAVTPACAQSCPTQAITFGNLNDDNSRVSKLKEVDRNYDLLRELNTRPRTSYLAKLRNPNPELV
jgi:MoCo/4Fe-4S cofactor protein with predicted Tat translocation signal